MLKREGAIRSSTEGKLEWKPIMLTEKKKFTNEPIGYRGRRRGVVEGIDISTESGRPYPLGGENQESSGVASLPQASHREPSGETGRSSLWPRRKR